MPFTKRRAYKKRPYRRYKKSGMKLYKKLYPRRRHLTITETFVPSSNPTINTNTGYLFTTNMNQLPATQLSSYATLYNQYCIRKLQIILVPRYDLSLIHI